MEQPNLSNNRSQSSLYQDVRISFTPSFFSNGWECMLSPIHELSNTHVDSVGSIRIDIKGMLLKVKEVGKKAGGLGSLATTVVRLFL